MRFQGSATIGPPVIQHRAVTSSRSNPPLGLSVLTGATVLLLFTALYLVFVVAPVEAQMGIVQKIFYFHVPSAYAMYIGFGASAVGSAAYLWKRDDFFDALAAAGAEVGLLFTSIVLCTGPLWARKAWGVYWTWDPRLTSTLLAGLIFASMLMLRNSGDNASAIERRFAAGLSLVGLLILPIIHYSVKRWQGQHPTVITNAGGGIAPSMRPALIVGFILFTALAVLLIWVRHRVERDKQLLALLQARALDAGAQDV